MNLNSTLRKFIPFGARGTIVGKTEQMCIVMFDEQFLHGNNIYGHCENYRGAIINPAFLLNLSRQFARMVKENYQAAKKFQEKPLKGCPMFADELDQNADLDGVKEQYLKDRYKNQQQFDQSSKRKPGFKPNVKKAEVVEETKQQDNLNVQAAQFVPK